MGHYAAPGRQGREDSARRLGNAIFNHGNTDGTKQGGNNAQGTNNGKPADTKGTPDDPNNPDPNKKDNKAKVLQTGGNTIDKRTANGLNEHFDQDLNRREWGKALEELKKENGLKNDFHGRIMSNGNYVSPQGSVIDNIGGYIK